MSVYEIGQEHIFQEVNRIFPSVLQNNTTEIKKLAEVASKKLRNAIASSITEKMLPAHTEEFTGTLPLGTRFHRRVRDTTILVVEQAPTKRTILITPDVPLKPKTWQKRGMKPLRCYTVPFPYMVFVFRFKWFRGEFDSRYFDEPCVQAFYRTKPIESENDLLYHTNLPNVESTNCKICMGQTLDQFAQSDFSDINKYTHKYLARFWSRGFTTDYQENYHALAEKHPEYFSTIRKWQVAGKKNANFVMDIRYRSCRHLKDIYDRAFKEGQELVNTACAQEVHNTMEHSWKQLDEEIERVLEGRILTRNFIRGALLKIWRATAREIEYSLGSDDLDIAKKLRDLV